MADNLELQGGTWHVRLAIPKDVQKVFGGRKILSQSLKTGSRREAMSRRLSIIDAWKTAIKNARDGVPLPEGWQDDVVLRITAIDEVIRGRKLALIGEAVKQPDLSAEEQERLFGASYLFTLIRSLSLPGGQAGIDDKLRLLQNIQQGLTTRIPEYLARRHTIPAEQRQELESLVVDPSARKSRSLITAARIRAFREFRESRGGAAKHVGQQITRLEKLSKFLSDNGLTLSFDSVDLWIKSLNRAPATLAQHLMAGTAFWQWATKYDPALRDELKTEANPFVNHDLPQGGGKETSGQPREIYSPADADKLYHAALQIGNVALADLIQFGWYIGARIEELCRVRKVDVITVDGILCLDIQRGKNRASERVVPVHSAVQPVVERLIAASTDEYLIPVSGKLPHGKRSHALSKAFGRLRTAAGFGPLHVFHSFRHTAVTTLIREGVPDGLVKELVGHDADDVTRGVYSRGSTAKQKLDAISKITLISTIE
ncbi:tyrosine-type recombinase/integrase [Pseudomonas syringae]|uniref:tyrosine-type recombinase/integrase n=1 Tax=Pseudomonas syringae TaxID=317 RepID=UPI0006CB666B|nr:tyrosine-type recombinase/integrase [Pseudomonas syringae]ALE01041.1 hypothetical protein PSYRMG_25260 [Pseudomonas syringae UMAF0158]MCK9731908.1 tyrosine-type recombinase/integrase [Pseudomonas syringae pv. syringae]